LGWQNGRLPGHCGRPARRNAWMFLPLSPWRWSFD
jgi:hypothetical protein